MKSRKLLEQILEYLGKSDTCAASATLSQYLEHKSASILEARHALMNDNYIEPPTDDRISRKTYNTTLLTRTPIFNVKFFVTKEYFGSKDDPRFLIVGGKYGTPKISELLLDNIQTKDFQYNFNKDNNPFQYFLQNYRLTNTSEITNRIEEEVFESKSGDEEWKAAMTFIAKNAELIKKIIMRSINDYEERKFEIIDLDYTGE